MEKLQIHNKRLNAWFIVDNGKVYDAKTMIQCPDNARETIGALQFVKQRLETLWNKMGEIDPIWGDINLYQQYEHEWLRMRQALYGQN